MGPNASLYVQGTLVARGTVSAPISFTSASSQPVPGGWAGVTFSGPSAATSVLDHVQLFYGAAGQNGFGMLSLVGGANITMTNSVVAQGTKIGLWMDDVTRPTIANCTFAGLSTYAVEAPVDDLGLITGSAFGPNQLGLHLRGGTITHSASWELPAVPLVLEGGTRLAATARLSIAPGTVVEMDPNASLFVQGALVARGTASAPISFTSASSQPVPGSWAGLTFSGPAAATSVLDHVQLFYGGAGQNGFGMLSLIGGANLTITNSVVAQGTTIGIWIDDNTTPAITSCTFHDLKGSAISVRKQNAARIHGNTFAPGQQPVQQRS
jgi:hypothetical protein